MWWWLGKANNTESVNRRRRCQARNRWGAAYQQAGEVVVHHGYFLHPAWRVSTAARKACWESREHSTGNGTKAPPTHLPEVLLLNALHVEA